MVDGILGGSVQNFMQLGGHADFYFVVFGVLYLARCGLVMDPARAWIRFCANLGKSATETLATIRQAFGEEGMGRTWVFEWHARFRGAGKTERPRAKSRACLSFSFTSRGMFIKNSSWQAEQSIPHTIVTFYGDCMKMCEDFTLKFGNKRTACCITTTHHPTLTFSMGNLPKTKWLLCPTQSTFLCFLIEDKTERLTFWHNWGDQGRIAGGGDNCHRTRFPGCI
jgi:hypothetical protein